jgi:hypothetical protein
VRVLVHSLWLLVSIQAQIVIRDSGRLLKWRAAANVAKCGQRASPLFSVVDTPPQESGGDLNIQRVSAVGTIVAMDKERVQHCSLIFVSAVFCPRQQTPRGSNLTCGASLRLSLAGKTIRQRHTAPV